MDLQATLAGSFTFTTWRPRLIRRTALTTGSVLPAGAAPGESAVPWGRAIPGGVKGWGTGETAPTQCKTIKTVVLHAGHGTECSVESLGKR
jgi:hypothetical protein